MSDFNLQPMHDLVYIEKEPTPEKVGNLYIPPGQQYLSHRGKVLAVGPGTCNVKGKFIPTTLQVGADVLYAPTESVEVTIGGRRLALAREAGVVAILDGVKPGAVFIG
jgi:co-chaperonin GroES (HSP10)